jgi:hypothetical protein
MMNGTFENRILERRDTLTVYQHNVKIGKAELIRSQRIVIDGIGAWPSCFHSDSYLKENDYV